MLRQISTLHQATSVPQIFWSFLAKAWDKPKSMYTTFGPRADAAHASYTGPNLRTPSQRSLWSPSTARGTAPRVI